MEEDRAPLLRVPEIRLPLDHSEEELAATVAARLAVGVEQLDSIAVARRSVDARKRGRVALCYTVDARLREGARPADGFAPPPDERYHHPEPGRVPLDAPVVVIGTGPAGLFAGLLLAEMGYRPLLFDRGRQVDERTEDVRRFATSGELDPESNVQFGEGGAGTFSDGKLYTTIRDARIRRVFETFVACGAPEQILWDAKPHIGTDRLREVVPALRRRIEDAGGEVRFGARLTDLTVESGRVRGVVLNGTESIEAGAVILAVGHSARDTFAALLARGVPMAPKAFSLGLRIEHPQAVIDRAQYGVAAGHPRLGAAEYKLAWRGPSGRSAYTFCVCPGGTVTAAASEEGGVVTNGMSILARDGEQINSALLVNVGPADFGGDEPLAGVEFQRHWERRAFALGGGGYRAPAQRLEDFLTGRPSIRMAKVVPSYRPGVTPADLSTCLPGIVIATLRQAIPALDRKLRGFAQKDAVLTGVETRSSSPLRMVRDGDHESPLSGLYPCGEGAGHAGGIVSAAVDGLRTAEAVIRRFAPPA